MALQFLAAENDAERLSQAGIPVISYSVRPWGGQTATGGIHVAGPQSLITTVAKYQPSTTNSCDSLLANDTVLAQIQVPPQMNRAHSLATLSLCLSGAWWHKAIN